MSIEDAWRWAALVRVAVAVATSSARSGSRPPRGCVVRLYDKQGNRSEAVALADRVLVIEEGRIAHDINIDIPRPRRRGSADLAALEGAILRDLLHSADEASEH